MRFAVLLLLVSLPAAAKESPYRIVFLSERAGQEKAGLFVMHADGTQTRELVSPKRDVMHFACAPDGSRVAHVTDPSGIENFELKVLALATGKETDIHYGIRWFPRWSRDGKRLAFMNHSRGWRVRLTNPDLLVDRPPQKGVGGDGAPSWSPDARHVVFQSNRDGNLELYVVNTKDGKLHRLTKTKDAETLPRYSPDGKWIAYRRGRDVWMIRPDGTGAVNLTSHAKDDHTFSWSPTANLLVLVSERSGISEICTLDPTTKTLVNLSRNPASDCSPAWSPDGRRILFVSDRDGNSELYVMVADGTGVRRLTRTAAREYAPAWLK